jgi:CBS domain-containing protein
MSAKVKDVMTTHVVTVRTNASFKEIATALRDQRVSAFPVLDDAGKVIGVVSEADLIAKESLVAGYGGHPGPLSGLLNRHELEKAKGATAAELMSQPPVTADPDDLVSHAAHLMHRRHVRRLPVVDKDGRLVGIISRIDVLSVFGRPDEEIRREVTETVIRKDFVTDPASFTVTVMDGIVTLEGAPVTAPMGRHIVGGVRHIEGVVAVRDLLAYPSAEYKPISGPLF